MLHVEGMLDSTEVPSSPLPFPALTLDDGSPGD